MRENNGLESDYKEKVKMEHDVCVCEGQFWRLLRKGS